MENFKYDKEKAIASLLYICNYLGGEWDKYSLLKILYFAEKKHLAKYGRSITGDTILALKYGPVPSESYSLTKSSPNFNLFVEQEDNIIKANGDADLDMLSETDIECIEESISENRSYNFYALKVRSHDHAYHKTVDAKGLNSAISAIDIAECGGASPEILAYIRHNIEQQNCVFHDTPNW